VRFIGDHREEAPICGGKCGARHRRLGEYPEVSGDVRSEPGTRYPINRNFIEMFLKIFTKDL
jgi:hypothetical protein